MRAVRISRAGDPSVLRVAEVPDPGPPTGDRLRVRVAASSINGTDLGLRRGAPGAALFGNVVGLGFDVVGEVDAVGPEVTAFAPGERVAALLPHRGGGQAGYVLLRQGRAARVPDEVTTIDAGGLPLAGLTALQALFGKAGLGFPAWSPEGAPRTGAGEPDSPRVLVVGASGGIGSFAVQLAALAGATVTGTARAAKHAYVRELGATAVREHGDLGGGRGNPERYDVVFDTPGRLDPALIDDVVAPGGVVVTTRVASPRTGAAILRGRLHRGPRAAFVATAARSADLAHLLELVRVGRLRVPVDRVFPLDGIVEAHRYAEGPEIRGKVVITVP